VSPADPPPTRKHDASTLVDPPHDASGDLLALADWRRRVAGLYATVRELAEEDPEAAWRHWRSTREALYRTHPQSPVPATARPGFHGRYWPYDPALRFVAEVRDDARAPRGAGATPAIGALTLDLPMSSGDARDFARIGAVEVELAGGPRSLEVYWMAGYAGGLFLPFRDATNGNETYGAGRYLLDTAKSADLGAGPGGRGLVLDFNFAFQPSCAFDPRWSCPLAPPANRLEIRIEAGERIA
jgi:uncharacterized protein